MRYAHHLRLWCHLVDVNFGHLLLAIAFLLQHLDIYAYLAPTFFLVGSLNQFTELVIPALVAWVRCCLATLAILIDLSFWKTYDADVLDAALDSNIS